MPLLRGLDSIAAYAVLKRSELDKIFKHGKELPLIKQGNTYVVDSAVIDAWKALKVRRTVTLTRQDFLEAFKFALKINYAGHTRADFGTARQRSVTQAVENWTQGALAEIALTKFIQEKFSVILGLEFKVFTGVIVGQDIVSVTRGRVQNPPRKRISVKSGKENGMILIVPTNEVELPQRVSDYYVFVRVLYENDFILRLLRDHPTIAELQDEHNHALIPELHDAKAEIVGFCKKEELEHRTVPEAQIRQYRYVRASGNLHNTDADWQQFTNQL